MLAFVMVFTGMGIGNWGVDEAWADGLWDGDYQFEVYVDGTKYDVMNTGGWPSVLVPEGTTELKIKQKDGFPALVFAMNGGGGLYADEGSGLFADWDIALWEDGNYSSEEKTFTFKIGDNLDEAFGMTGYTYTIYLSDPEGTGNDFYIGFISSSNSIPTLSENINPETRIAIIVPNSFSNLFWKNPRNKNSSKKVVIISGTIPIGSKFHEINPPLAAIEIICPPTEKAINTTKMKICFFPSVLIPRKSNTFSAFRNKKRGTKKLSNIPYRT